MPPTLFPSVCLPVSTEDTHGPTVAPGGAPGYCTEGSGMQHTCEILDLVLLLVFTARLLFKSVFGKLVDLSQNE